MEVEGTWSCHWKQDAVGFRLTMLGEPGTRVIFAAGPRDDQYTPPNIPMVLVRRITRQTHFVSLLVPRRGKVTNHALEKVSLSKGVLTLRIVSPGCEDYVALNLAFRARARRLTIVHGGKEHSCKGICLYKRFRHSQTQEETL